MGCQTARTRSEALSPASIEAILSDTEAALIKNEPTINLDPKEGVC